MNVPDIAERSASPNLPDPAANLGQIDLMQHEIVGRYLELLVYIPVFLEALNHVIQNVRMGRRRNAPYVTHWLADWFRTVIDSFP
ncbi:hypothetical protein D3C73_575430 [compost metagenome]